MFVAVFTFSMSAFELFKSETNLILIDNMLTTILSYAVLVYDTTNKKLAIALKIKL